MTNRSLTPLELATLTSLSHTGNQTPEDIFNSLVLTSDPSVISRTIDDMRGSCEHLYTLGLLVRNEIVIPRRWYNVDRNPIYRYIINVARLIDSLEPIKSPVVPVDYDSFDEVWYWDYY